VQDGGVQPQPVVLIVGRDNLGEVVGECVLGDGNLKKIAQLGEFGGLEVEGNEDERLDALDVHSLSLENSVGGTPSGSHEEEGEGGAEADKGKPRAAAVEVGEEAWDRLFDTMIE
jgi:hypothetical protein